MHLDGDSYEGEMVEGKAVGYGDAFKVRNNSTIHGAGVINPAGVHFLERFAEVMAAGNQTLISDGSHGYDQQQPEYIRSFLAEYRALPPVSMKPLEVDADPIALWQGVSDGKLVFYVVNRLDSKLDCAIRFDGKAKVKSLSSGEKLKLDGSLLKLSLEPYQLLAFEGGPESVSVVELKSVAPESLGSVLRRQAAFAAALASGSKAVEGPLPMTPGELKLAAKSAAMAMDALDKGRLLTARRILLSPALTRLYEIFHSYPPGLLHRKAPVPPVGSLDAAALRACAVPKANPTQVFEASRLDSALTGVTAFTWGEQTAEIGLQEHFSNRFGLELVYVKAGSAAMPEIAIDGLPLPSSSFSIEDGGSWGRMSLSTPFALAAGSHSIRLSKAKDSDVAVIYLKVDAVPRDIVSSDWMLLGPFNGSDDPRRKDDFDAKMATKFPSGVSCDLNAKFKGLDGREVSWTKSQEQSDYVDFYKLTGEKSFRIGYAYCDIESPAERDAQITFGVDYWAKIWLGDKEVYSVLGGHEGPHKGEFSFPVRLAAGKNRLLVKLHAGGNGNGFWMSITDPGDLKFSVN